LVPVALTAVPVLVAQVMARVLVALVVVLAPVAFCPPQVGPSLSV
jgi:hypothetical protein